MAAAFVSRLILRRPSRLCFSYVIRPSSLSSFLSCHVLHKENKLRVQVNRFKNVMIFPASHRRNFPLNTSRWEFVLGSFWEQLTSVDNAICAGKEDSSASRNDQEYRACTTPINSGFLRDPSSGRFSTSSKTEKAKQKAAQLIATRNIKAGKAKRKLTMDSDQEGFDESKKVRRTSLVSLL